MEGHRASERRTTLPRATRPDLLFYAVGVIFALVSAIFSEFYGYRVWGNFATAGYGAALLLSLLSTRVSVPALRSRWTPVWVVAVLAIAAPVLFLVFRRAPDYVWGPWPWSFPSQPEVWVVERSARLLIDHGTPYLDLTALGRPPVPDDYTPYGPVMSVFGLPRALLGDSGFTDARLVFILASVLIIVLALRVLGRPRIPVGAVQLAAVSPLTALTACVGGDDLPVIALVVLATALAYRGHPVWTAVVCALVVSMKLTALPAVAVLAVAVVVGHRTRAFRALATFVGVLLGVLALVTVPVLVRDPASFVEHVIKFPAGLGKATSPAASPLPGHLIAMTGPVGHTIAIVLLAIAAVTITTWLVLRPPRTASDAMLRIATGLGTAIMLAPATRWGYLVYPLAMIGAVLGFRATESGSDHSGLDNNSDHTNGHSATDSDSNDLAAPIEISRSGSGPESVV